MSENREHFGPLMIMQISMYLLEASPAWVGKVVIKLALLVGVAAGGTVDWLVLCF